MTEFTDFHIEVSNTTSTDSSDWVWQEITDDVLVEPRPRWNRGIMSNRHDAHVADPGYFTFSLNNSVSNSAGLAGYYSPDSSNCWDDSDTLTWTTGLKVHLVFDYDANTYYKFLGTILPDGIKVIPGIYGERRVDVTCGDYMWRAQQHELKSLTYSSTGDTLDTLVTKVDANMPFGALALSSDTADVGTETFPTIFDMTYMRTTAMSEYIKGAMSEWGYIYVVGTTDGSEQLIVENKTHRSNEDVKQIDSSDVTFYTNISPGMELSYGTTMVNRVLATVYPRTVDTAATSVLCATNRRVKVEPGETITDYRLGYRDPNNPSVKVSGIDMVLADSDGTLDTTDWTASTSDDTDLTVNDATSDYVSSTDITAVMGTESAIFSVYNHHATAPVYMYLQARGRGVYTYDPIRNESNDSDSQNMHGVVPLTLDMKYLTDPRKAQWVSDYLINIDGDPHTSIETCPMWANRDDTNMKYFLQCKPGDRVHIQEDQSGIHGDYFINGYSAEIASGKYVLWSPILKADPAYMSMWVPHETGIPSNWWGVAYGNAPASTFVIVSIDHLVMTSTDGVTWTSRVAAAANDWKSVCYSSDLGMYVAVAITGTSDDEIMTSTDYGVTWVSRSSNDHNTWRSVVYGDVAGGYFVAVADGGTSDNQVMSSTDGITWWKRSAPSDHDWEDVCYSSALGMFCAVARDNTSDNIMTSTDAINWTQRGTPGASQLFGIAWSPTLAIFAAVGYGAVYTSPDGITWTAQAYPVGYWHSIAWSEEKGIFVAVGGSGSVGDYKENRFMTSRDGVTWTAKTNIKDGNWHHVCWSSELDIFCAVGGYYVTNVALSK